MSGGIVSGAVAAGSPWRDQPSGSSPHQLQRFHPLVGAVPFDLGKHDLILDALFVFEDDLKHAADQFIAQEMWLETEVEQFSVHRVEIMLFHFDAWVGDMVDFGRQAEFAGLASDQLSQLQDGEGFGELIEHTIFSGLGRIEDGQFHAAHGVANVQEAPALPSFSVDGERDSGGGLHAEAVDGGPENVVIVEAGRQPFVEAGLVRLYAIDDALVQVGSGKLPGAAGKTNVVAVVNF